MKLQTKIYILIGLVAGLSFLLFLFIEDSNEPQKESSGTPKQNIVNEQNGNYYETTEPTVTTTPIPENLEQKLIEEGKIAGVQLSFDKNGFQLTQALKFQLQTNIKLDVDADNTGLPAGTSLKLSIPGAGLDSSITIPGRYRYSIYFKETGAQEIILSGDGLVNGRIKKTIEIK